MKSQKFSFWRGTILAISTFLFTNICAARDIPPEDILLYLNTLSSSLAGRRINADEKLLIEKEGPNAANAILTKWLESPIFIESARNFIETKLATSGVSDEIDFSRPGKLMAYLVKDNRPYREILFRCGTVDGKEGYCDTGAWDWAGVLNMRAFLVSQAGRFNIVRAKSLLKEFLCSEYPHLRSLQNARKQQKTRTCSLKQSL